jgi:hypothetical protein
VARHEILRTSIATKDGAPQPIVRPHRPFRLSIVDFESYEPAARDAARGHAAKVESEPPVDQAHDHKQSATWRRISCCARRCFACATAIICSCW